MIVDLEMAKEILESIDPMYIVVPDNDYGTVSGFILYSANWCNPCNAIKPKITKYINYIVDLTHGNLTDVHSIPTIRAYSNGKVIDEIVGPTTVKDVIDFYNRNVEEVLTSMYITYQDQAGAFDIESFYDTMRVEGEK